MTTLSGVLSVANTALHAAQLAIQTTSNNVANAGTPGYSRQRVDLRESPPDTLPVGQIGTGVSVASIRRLHDQFLDQQFYQAQQAQGEYQAEQSTLTQIEGLLNEPSDTGLQASLSSFFASLNDLASYPSDPTTRQAALEQAQILAGDFKRLSGALVSIKRNLESEIQSRVSEANGLLSEIASLNGQIQTVTVAGGSPNTLMDRRDVLLDNLSQLVNITRLNRSDGAVDVSLTGGGGILISGTTAGTLGAQLSGTSDDYQLTLGTAVITPTGGEIAGLLRARNDPTDYVKYAQEQLDTLASTLIQQLNRLQVAGAGTAGLTHVTNQYAVSSATVPLGTAGLPFPVTAPGNFTVFVYDASTGAVTGSGTVNITTTTTLTDMSTQLAGIAGLSASVSGGALSVSAASGSTFRFANDTSNVLTALGLNALFTGTNAQTIAVNGAVLSDPRLLSTGTPDSTTGVVGAGDNSAVLAMAGLAETPLLTGGSATVNEFYAATIGTVGARTATMNRLTESQNLVLQTIQNQRDQVSGVSIDEEMTDLIRFQHAYQASARLIQVVDGLMDTIVNTLLK